jgi:NADH:ubiquinone oxidoreductase subunit H
LIFINFAILEDKCGGFRIYLCEIKLFSREQYFPLVSNYLSYYFSPDFRLFLSLLVWVLIPYFRGFVSFELGLLFLYVAQDWVFILLWLLVDPLILFIPYWGAFIR